MSNDNLNLVADKRFSLKQWFAVFEGFSNELHFSVQYWTCAKHRESP